MIITTLLQVDTIATSLSDHIHFPNGLYRSSSTYHD